MFKRVKIALLALVALALPAISGAVEISSRVMTPSSLPYLQLQRGESLSWTLSGTATGQILIERSGNGIDWVPAGVTVNAAGTILATGGDVLADGNAGLYRWRCSTITAVNGGTFTVTMADNDDVFGVFKNNRGDELLKLHDISARLNGILNFNPGETVAVSSTTRITRDSFPRTYNVLTSSGGAIVVGELPTISTSSAVTGDIYIIHSATDTITYSDNGTVTGTLLELGSTTRALGVGDILVLIYRAGKWWEMGFFNN